MPVDREEPVSPEISVQLVVPFKDCCHWILPVFPVKLTVVLLPEQKVELAAEAVPATEVGLTVTVTTLLVADEQTPLVTIAL